MYLMNALYLIVSDIIYAFVRGLYHTNKHFIFGANLLTENVLLEDITDIKLQMYILETEYVHFT